MFTNTLSLSPKHLKVNQLNECHNTTCYNNAVNMKYKYSLDHVFKIHQLGLGLCLGDRNLGRNRVPWGPT